MFVKICGITHPADASAAVAASADAIGLNFVPTSRHCIDIETARAILAVTPDQVMTVGVFRNHAIDEILELVLYGCCIGDSRTTSETLSDFSERASELVLYLVAGAGFEPATFGL